MIKHELYYWSNGIVVLKKLIIIILYGEMFSPERLSINSINIFDMFNIKEIN